MGAYLVKPETWTLNSASAASATTPATNLLLDHPGRIWQSTADQSGIDIIVQGAGQTVDTVALVGASLLPTDTITVRFGTTAALAGTNAAVYSGPVYTGVKDASISTIAIARFTAQAFNYCKITIGVGTARSITAQRLVIGAAVTNTGVDYDAEQTFEDASVEVGGVGYSAYEPYPTLVQWKVQLSQIIESDWQAKWFPLLSWAGNSKGILFNPDDTNNYQSGITFGRITSTASGKIPGWNNRNVTLSIKALAP